MNLYEMGESPRSAEPKWFSGLSARFRDYAANQDAVQKQKELATAAVEDAADASRIKAKSAGAATKSVDAVAARTNIGQVINALITPNTFEFGRRTGGILDDNTGILNEIGQNIAYMKQIASKERAATESLKPPKPEESRGHWQGGSEVAVEGNLVAGNQKRADLRDGDRQYLDVATLRPVESADENWAVSGGLLHLDDDYMDFVDAAGNVHSLARSYLWAPEWMSALPPNVTVRIPLGPDGELPWTNIPWVTGTADFSTGFSIYFHGGLEKPAMEYAKLYGETLEKYNSGEIDSNEFDRRVELMDKYFDEVAQGERRGLRDIIGMFSGAMRVQDPKFFDVSTDSDVEAFLSDVGRMYDNIRDHIKSAGSIDGLTKEIIEAGCVVSSLDDVKFLHSDKFWMDYMAPAMKALETEKGLGIFQAKIGAKWVEEHAKTWVDLNTGVDADALSNHLKGLLLKLVNYGNDYRPGSFLQQLPYDEIGR
jgi:hypothetical protein